MSPTIDTSKAYSCNVKLLLGDWQNGWIVIEDSSTGYATQAMLHSPSCNFNVKVSDHVKGRLWLVTKDFGTISMSSGNRILKILDRVEYVATFESDRKSVIIAPKPFSYKEILIALAM